ncbi:murein biosynthesis integral membrane protein MurJ [Prochlorococcus sp. MIT 1223]|uniref:murein biosynthesis integral membrane protein MurJ n=1 Tax=Prochlorococcus sp. MIT 1223 TaxID=3096217 RepID=UPI002A75F49A|nr:murein biosynthesis integral membrane protein MurJ [Prochlorococcus sp. MIT 1223]
MTKSIKKIAAIVTLGTLLSKSGGMLRQLVIAGAFGIGTAYDAYNYAYIIPGFFLVLLGGLNGPLHNAIVSVLSRKKQKEAQYITASVNTIVAFTLIIISGIIFIAADQLIRIIAPGLTTEVHQIAVVQLQIMSPIAFISAFIGIGFGALNSKDEFFIPSISPVISSIVLIVFIGIFWLTKSQSIQSIDIGLKGGIILAAATLIGAILQWGIQLPSLIRKGFTPMKFAWNINHSGVKEVLQIVGPASLSSGMLQFNVFTDLFFASRIIGAAAGLSYANFLIQAPLGLVSNALLIPLLPTYSKLKNKEDRSELIKKIDQGLTFSTASMIVFGAILISLSHQIIELIYARGAFDTKAIILVSQLLIAYAIGMPFYLGRDLLVRIFYALGDAKIPFKISIIGIILNIIFDWLLIGGPTPWGNQVPFNFGAPGLIYATVIVNLSSCIALLLYLKNKIKGLPFKKWFFNLIKMIFSGCITALIIYSMSSIILWNKDFLSLLIEVTFSASLGVFTFTLMNYFLKVSEINELVQVIKKNIIRF